MGEEETPPSEKEPSLRRALRWLVIGAEVYPLVIAASTLSSEDATSPAVTAAGLVKLGLEAALLWTGGDG